jgi:DNA-binding XRE family transcriptional regulator
MGQRQHNYRRVKIHRSYAVEEAARLLGAHKNTIRAWVKGGLPTCDRKRPTLILGRDLAAFLKDRRTRRKQPCQLDEIYCVRCRAPKTPAANMVEYKPVTEKIGNLTAICPDCYSIMNRRVSVAKLGSVQGKMGVTFPQALPRLSESYERTVNSDFE